MRPRLTLLRLWPQRLAADRTHSGRRTFSFTQAIAATGHWSRNPRTRPQLPFLAVPTTTISASAAPATPRYFTTQRRRWLRYEALAFAKYTLYFWAAVSCVVLGQFVIQQEWMERAHPTPPEWSYMSRLRLRGALSERGDSGGGQAAQTGGEGESTDVRVVDHVKVIQILLDLLARLENPSIDGGAGLAGVLDVVDDADAGGVPPLPIVADSQAMDIRAKSEPWRRGYYEALLAAAATAEHVDGWVRDRTRDVVCPPDIVVGPSNPHPRPLPPGASGAPREEDCEPCFPAPAELYLKLLHTRGLTPRQQITAALAFANYLEYKQDRDAAAYVYGRAVLAARAPHEEQDSTFFAAGPDDADAPTWIKNWTTQNHAANSDDQSAVPVSQNLLATLTAYATFQARTGDVAAALPLFVSLLQARRSLPPSKSSFSTSDASAAAARSKPSGIVDQLIALVTPPGYPPPPDDGFGPPLPGARARCEEAALRLHIGEVLYASAPKSTQRQQQQAREEGIAWTREAVDTAEEQLHALAQNEQQQQQKGAQGVKSAPSHAVAASSASSPADGRATCRQCLVAGLDNWAAMVAQLARDEQRRSAADLASANAGSASSWTAWPSWLSLWGEGSSAPAATSGGGGTISSANSDAAAATKKLGRWAAEENVIQDRRRRARELLDDAAPPPRGFMALFTA